MKAIIVDDEQLSRQKIRQLLSDHNDVSVLGEAENGLQALDLIQEKHPDLVFLDIQMPEMNGVELVDALLNEEGQTMPQIVFITAYDEFAIKAFELNAIDYLLKPIKAERFDQALEKCRSRSREQIDLIKENEALIKAYRASISPKFVSATYRNKTYPVPINEVRYVKADGNYAKIYAGDKFYVKRITLTDLESTLNNRDIVRVHKSHLVNINHIAHFEAYFHSDLMITLKSGEQIKCSRHFADQLKKTLG